STGHTNSPDVGNELRQLITEYLDLLDTSDQDYPRLDDQRIHIFEQGLLLFPDNHPHKPKLLIALSDLLQNRFERLGNLLDIDQAIMYSQQAVLLALDDDEDKPFWLNSLGNCLQRRFEHLGSLADINMAILNENLDLKHRSANLALQERCGYLKLGLINDLGIAYQTRFTHSGEIADIDAAIQYKNQLALLTPEGHVTRPNRLNNLGTSYFTRFRRLRELSDLDHAIDHLQQAVLHSDHEDRERHHQLNNLGVALLARFARLGDLEDINKAIGYQSQGLQLVPDGSINRTILINNLGNCHLERFYSAGELADVNKSIELKNIVLSHSPQDHALRPSWLSDLGISYRGRFKLAGETADIEKAIEHGHQAVILAPIGHTDRAEWLLDLGKSYRAHSERTGSLESINAATHSFRDSSKAPVGHPVIRMEAARQWANMAGSQNESSVLDAYTQLISLIPQVIWLGATVGRRYKDVASAGGIATEAAAVAIEFKAYELALEWLEEGRSIVWNQLLQLRAPIEELRSAHPELAGKLQRLATELEYSSQISAGSDIIYPTEQFAQQRRRSAQDWEKVLEQVRNLPGFNNFLRPKKAADLFRATESIDALVVVNVHERRCDALVLQSESTDIMHIPLPAFSYNTAVELRTQLLTSLKLADVRTRAQRQPVYYRDQTGDCFESILETLWVDVVEPVLNALGYLRRTPNGRLPHLVRCTTGPLAFLPLHAAGRYGTAGSNASDFVVSSYTPTLSALEISVSSPTQFQGVLAVGQEATVGCVPLPGTVAELDEIQEQASRCAFTRLDGNRATINAVLSAMEEHSWVHLACHASQNLVDPTASAFQLHDGELSLATITSKSLKHAGLAFLSACETAMGDEQIPDESVHLAAGMLMIGYPSVMATMWSIKDEDAPLVAKIVYTHMLQVDVPDLSRAAEALHFATACLRAKVGDKEFWRWVPYIHVGR
ncbi:hypothetical protein FRC10_008179, partial [Ceratobasidium sp. 414]